MSDDNPDLEAELAKQDTPAAIAIRCLMDVATNGLDEDNRIEAARLLLNR